jgi:hypothetical protein
VPFDPANVVETTIGTGKLTFTDGNNGTFDYTVNGVTQSKAITRQVFARAGKRSVTRNRAPDCARSARYGEPGERSALEMDSV